MDFRDELGTRVHDRESFFFLARFTTKIHEGMTSVVE